MELMPVIPQLSLHHSRGLPNPANLPQPTALPPHRGEFPKVVEGSQSIQLLQSQQEGLVRWRVQEIKVHEVMDPCREM